MSHIAEFTCVAAIFGRIVQHERGDLSPEAARSFLDLRLHDDDTDRMHRLSLKAQEGELTAEEQEAIESYRRVGYLLGILWSKARLSLKHPEPPPTTS